MQKKFFFKNRLTVVISIALVLMCVMLLFSLYGRSKPSIKIGILHSLSAPGGMVAIDRETRHLWKTPRIGRARQDGQFDIVWDAGSAVEPVPFPSYRFRDEWLHLLQSVAGK